MPDAPARHRTVTLQQAAEGAPQLARLVREARDGQERLRAIESLIPAPLRPSVQAGPADGGTWCLLVEGSAAAAKLRQLAPALQARLRDRGWEVTAIRLKVQAGGGGLR